jgi:predicted dehydrogenase
MLIAGCGFACRKIHASRISALGDHYQVVAVADPVEQNAIEASQLFHCEAVFRDAETMLDAIDAEAMAIFTPIHSNLVKAGLEHNLDLFVEKPFCETPLQSREMAALADQKGRIVQIGAMRVFDPAVDYVRSQLETIGPVRWVEIHDYCGQSLSSGSGGSMIARTFQSAIPMPDGQPRNGVQTMLLEFIHDISILRGVFGLPLACRSSLLASDGWSAAGVLDLAGDIPCLFGTTEYGLPKVNHFEVQMTIYGENGLLIANFGDANMPGGGETVVEHENGEKKVFHHDVFQEEWDAFHQAVRDRKLSKNSAHDGAADVNLGWEIIEVGLRNKG